MPCNPILAEAMKRVKYSDPDNLEKRGEELSAEIRKVREELAALPEDQCHQRTMEIVGFRDGMVIIR